MRFLSILLAAAVLLLAGAVASAPAHAAGDTCAPRADIPDPGDQDCDGVRTDGNGPVDNCPSARNADQRNTDANYTPSDPPSQDGAGVTMQAGDGAGDACDGDDDADGIPDYRDADGDGAADDVDDNCRTVRNPHQYGPETTYGGLASDAPDAPRLCPPTDGDGDGFYDDVDNCRFMPNPGQEDLDRDGLGDVCEGDDDGDNVPDDVDNCRGYGNPKQEDADHDGIGRICDPDELFPPAPPVEAASSDKEAPQLRLAQTATRRFDDLLGGLPTAVRCSEACSLTGRLVLAAADARRLHVGRTLPASPAFVGGAGSTFLFWRPARATARALSRTRLRAVRATLTVRAVDEAGNAVSVSRMVVLRR